MAKKKLPTDVGMLREMLRKLRDREVRLEADLAIKEHPELEDAIIAVVLRLTDAKKAKVRLDAVQPGDHRECARLQALQRRAAYYREQLASIEAALCETTAGEKFAGFQSKFDESRALLGAEFAKRQEALEERGVRLLELLPSLDEFLPKPSKEGA